MGRSIDGYDKVTHPNIGFCESYCVWGFFPESEASGVQGASIEVVENPDGKVNKSNGNLKTKVWRRSNSNPPNIKDLMKMIDDEEKFHFSPLCLFSSRREAKTILLGIKWCFGFVWLQQLLT